MTPTSACLPPAPEALGETISAAAALAKSLPTPQRSAGKLVDLTRPTIPLRARRHRRRRSTGVGPDSVLLVAPEGLSGPCRAVGTVGKERELERGEGVSRVQDGEADKGPGGRETSRRRLVLPRCAVMFRANGGGGKGPHKLRDAEGIPLAMQGGG